MPVALTGGGPCAEAGAKALNNYICVRFEPWSLRLCLTSLKKETATWGALAAPSEEHLILV